MDENLNNKDSLEEFSEKKNKDGTIQVSNGKIIVKNPLNDGKPASIIIGGEAEVFIDGKIVKGKVDVFEKNKIEVIFNEKEGKRNINIKTSRDLMKAFIDISYEPQIIYGLKDIEEKNSLSLEIQKIDEIYPPFLKKEDIEKALIDTGIMYGINREAILECISSRDVRALLIAEGKLPKNFEEDRIELKFEETTKEFKEDLKGTIDYKSIGHVRSVKKGELLGIMVKGNPGYDGVNVKGKIIKAKRPKILRVICGNGCEQIGNVIKSTIEGKATYNAGKFTVSHVHEIKNNVDLSTGNIKFSGEIVVYGSVLEGMKVEGLMGVEIYKSVASAEIRSNGNIKIGSNVLLSTVTAGGTDTLNIRLKENLAKLIILIDALKKDCLQLANSNVLGRKARPGEIIKVLIENKYKKIPILINEFQQKYVIHPDYNKKFLLTLKASLLGFGPLNMKDYKELDEIKEIIIREKENIDLDDMRTSNIEITYCQDSVLNATGDIFITGRGEYISNITANEGVYFKGLNSIARGGIIKAKKVIECNFVGSDAGVKTEVKVGVGGEIFAKFAYQNTKFAVGSMEYTIDKPCRDVHVYVKDGELQIDKFNA